MNNKNKPTGLLKRLAMLEHDKVYRLLELLNWSNFSTADSLLYERTPPRSPGFEIMEYKYHSLGSLTSRLDLNNVA